MTYGDIRRGYRERLHYREAPSHNRRVIALGHVARLNAVGLIEIGLIALYGFSLSVRPSLSLSVCHTPDPRLSGSTYRNHAFCTIR